MHFTRTTSSFSAKEKNICRVLAEYILYAAKNVTKIKQKLIANSFFIPCENLRKHIIMEISFR